MRPLRVILIAAGLGLALGTGWAFHRDAEDEQKRRALDEATEAQLSGAETDSPAQTGKVTLAAVEGLPQYPGAFVRPISSGSQLNVAWFATKDSVDQVLSFYEKEFAAKNLLPVAYQFSPVSGYAGYMDPDHRMHLVAALRQGEETLVFPSTSYPKKMLEGGATPPAGVPNIAGAESALGFDLGGGGSRHVWLATYANQSVEQVTAAWSKGLQGNGWDVKRADEGAEARLEAERAEGSLQVAIRKDPSEKIAVYVTTGGPRGVP